MRFTCILIGILCLLCLFNHGNPTLDAQQTTSIQIEQPYLDPNWRPKAGSSLTFEIRVTVPSDFTSGTLNAVLENVTNYIGESGNVPQQAGNTAPDLELSATTGWSGNESTRSYTLNGTTTQTVSLQVNCKDYAAYGELKLTASGANYTSDTVTIKIPKDNIGNKIADGWRNDGTMNYGRDDDNDSGPNSKTGDNITVFNEYRGLNVGGSWTDTDPNGWDVFIQIDNTLSEFGIGGANALPMTLHEMATGEVDFDPGHVFYNYIEGGEHIPFYYTKPRGIRLTEFSARTDSEGVPISNLGDMGIGVPSAFTNGYIYTGVIASHINRWNQNGRDVDIIAFTGGVIAHEIGHGVSLGHCPDFDHPNCYMWIPGDWPLAHVTQYASHHDQDYALVGSYSRQSTAAGTVPDRTYVPGIGVRIRQPVDVNGDGVVDIIDLLTVTSNWSESGHYSADVNNDGTVDMSDLVLVAAAANSPTCTYTQLSEDVNGDGVVNILDLTLVASNIGTSETHVADVNGDCSVDILDLVLVASAFGNTVSTSEE